jgi:hypothetical protein
LHALLTNKKIRIPIKKKVGDPPTPRTIIYLVGPRGVFSKVVLELPNNEGHLPFSIKHRISSILPNIVGRLPFT